MKYAGNPGPLMLVFFVSLSLTNLASANPDGFFNNTVDWETRSLIDHEFQKDKNIRLGHTIDRHWGRSINYLKGRCTRGPISFWSAEIWQVKSTFGKDSWQITENVRDMLFDNREAIVRFARETNPVRDSRAYEGRLGDSYGHRFVLSTVYRDPPLTHDSTPMGWYLLTAFPLTDMFITL